MILKTLILIVITFIAWLFAMWIFKGALKELDRILRDKT